MEVDELRETVVEATNLCSWLAKWIPPPSAACLCYRNGAVVYRAVRARFLGNERAFWDDEQARRAVEHTVGADVFIYIRPVNSLTVSDNFEVCTLGTRNRLGSGFRFLRVLTISSHFC